MVIPIKIKVSFQIYAIPNPFSMILLMMIMNHLLGMILLRICNGSGMFSIGKIKPESKIVGSMSTNMDKSIAVC